MGSVLGSFGGFQGNIWCAAPFIPVGDQEGPQILIFSSWKIFHGPTSPDQYQSVKWSKTHILGDFQPNWRWGFFKKWPYVYSYFWLFLANFDYLGLIFGREHQKCTFSDLLGLIGTMKSKKLGLFAYLENWVPQVPQNPPWAQRHP